jgi:hypothetical protein
VTIFICANSRSPVNAVFGPIPFPAIAAKVQVQFHCFLFFIRLWDF